MNPKERLEALESQVRALQVEVASMKMDVYALKLINQILTKVDK